MGLKENFLQAVRELMGTPAPNLALETAGGGDMARRPEIKRASPFSRREEFFPAEEPAAAPAPAASPAAPAFREGPLPTAEQQERTTIATGSVVQGSIRATCSIDLLGEVYGDIASKENLKICGRLEGNASGQDIEIAGGRIKGDIIATGKVVVNNNSIILGNIRAETLILNGKVKGNLEVKGSLSLDVNAAVAGGVVAGRLAIAEGALLQGEVRISSTDLNKLFAEGEAAGKRTEAAVRPAAPRSAAPSFPPTAEAPRDEVEG